MSSGEKNLPSPTASKGPQITSPLETATEEVRFAVVMYGGISLAIYMNGIAQELLHLVRSTSPDPRDHTKARTELAPTEKVYRKLGQMLASGEKLPDILPKDDDPIRTRFVIDILSGSSAGGINAVFLAKALANDQSLDKLKDLWITQGDIGKLLNDKGVSKGNNLTQPLQPPSLLSGQRIYLELVRAMEGMDTNDENPPLDSGRSPNVEELDLFITATDVEGQVINLQLSDKSVTELRHRNLFHFTYTTLDESAGRPASNDFIRQNNPFLAFAARCTSAHPAAFNTMSLGDIGPVLQSSKDEFSEIPIDPATKEWEKFYADYLRPQFADGQETPDEEARKKAHENLVKEFLKRNFNDGGVLDNQPFGPTLETLPLHAADKPVTRKLVYIEPAPEHPEQRAEREGPPDFVENAWLSLSTLPRYEPIREHLQKVLERNRLVERIQHITKDMKQAVKLRYKGNPLPPLTPEEFSRADIVDMMERNGDAWGGYQMLRVAEVTDDITLLIARLAGFDEQSDEFRAIRFIVRYWRMAHYSPWKEDRPKEKLNIRDTGDLWAKHLGVKQRLTENMFLMQFDLIWRLRRLRFVLSKIDDIACFDARSDETVRDAEVENPDKVKANPDIFRAALVDLKKDLSQVYRRLRFRRHRFWSGHLNGSSTTPAKASDMSGLKAALTAQEPLAEGKKWLNKNYPLSNQADSMQEQRDAVLLELVGEKIKGLGINSGQMLSLLDKFSSEEERDDKIEEIVWRIGDDKFQAFADALELALDDMIRAAASRCDKILNDEIQGTPEEKMVRRVASYYYRYFDNYDVITHPILYATEVGEEIDFIEVFRISPEDAPSIINEAATSMREQGIRKLAGTKLSNFGGFFKEEFRRNDIRWGRLDGAERIISALLSGPGEDRAKKRKALIKEAHQAIIKEELGVEDDSKLLSRLKELTNPPLTSKQEQALEERLEDQRVQFAVGTFLRSIDAVDYFREQFLLNYETNFQFDNQEMIVDVARGSKVFGKMLEGYADKHQIKDKRLAWVTRLTQVFYGLVEVAIPDSIYNLFLQYWLQLLYLFEFLTILLGTLFVNPNMQHFGLLAFGLTIVLNGTELLIQGLMKGKRRWLDFLAFVFVSAIALLAIIGVAFVVGLNSEIVWNRLARFRGWYSTPPPGLLSLKSLVWVVAALLAFGFFVRSFLKSRRKRNSGPDEQKKSKPQVTAETKLRHSIVWLFAAIFIASATTLLIYKGYLSKDANLVPFTSDAAIWINVFTSLISAVGTVATIIFNRKRDKREEQEFKRAQLQSAETGAQLALPPDKKDHNSKKSGK
jgi:patatin-related protein